MIIRSIRHRGLQRLIEDDNPRSLSPDLAQRARNALTVLVLAEDLDSLMRTAPRDGESTGFPATGQKNGASQFLATGG